MSYKKIAFFVEGYTEQQFVKKLLVEIFGQKKIAIEIKQIKGGSKIATSYTSIETPEIKDGDNDLKYYVLIYNCGGDSSIKSYILDNRKNLIESGYSKVIGLRDIYPDFNRDEVSRLQKGLNYQLPQKDLPIVFVLSIMEIESWFLAENLHYSKIDNKLTDSYLKATFGFDSENTNTEDIDEPANFLKEIYTSVGKTYKKEKSHIDRTIDQLDYSNIYFNIRNKNISLNSLITEFEEIF
jgi:hypothetical protein